MWSFSVDPTKQWRVRVFAPAGMTFTTRDASTNDAIDSDARPQGLIVIPAAALTPGAYNPTFDAGLAP